MRKVAILAVSAILAGCTYPVSNDAQGAGPGQLYFPTARQNEAVAVDGRDAGFASAYAGKQTLAVPMGLHRVVLTADGKVIFDKKIYVGADAKVAVGEN